MGKIECLFVCLVQQRTLQALQGSAINKILNILQCTLPPRPVYQTLLQGSGSETRLKVLCVLVLEHLAVADPGGVRGVQMHPPFAARNVFLRT